MLSRILRPIFLILFLFFFSSNIIGQDICRDNFVTCVQATGDSFSCRSVYTNCLATGGTDLVGDLQSEKALDDRIESVVFNPQIIQLAGGLTSIRLSVSNPTSHPIQIGTATYPVRCANGSEDRAVFFMDFALDAGVKDTSAGGDQIACIGAGGAISIDKVALQAEGLASTDATLKYEFPCSDGESRWITLTYKPEQRIYRWQNSAKVLGVLNHDFIYEDQFAEEACSTVPASSSSNFRLKLSPEVNAEIDKAIKEISEWMGLPAPGTRVIYRNGITGVRG